MALWLVPAVIAVLGVAAVVTVLRRTIEEAQRLQVELARVRDLRPSVLELRAEAARLRAGVVERFDGHR